MATSLLIWVLGTWLVGALVINLAHRSGAGQLARQVNITAEGHLIGEIAAFMFHIGIPFVAVIVGALGLDVMVLGNVQPNTLLGFRATGMGAWPGHRHRHCVISGAGAVADVAWRIAGNHGQVVLEHGLAQRRL